MANINKVVWSEGMLLRHQHFQQQERYLENMVNTCSGNREINWGINALTINKDNLLMKKFSLNDTRGIFPDGTVFDTDDTAASPDAIEIPEGTFDTTIYLAIPLRKASQTEIATHKKQVSALTRYETIPTKVRDNTSSLNDINTIHVGQLKLRLLLSNQNLSQYACIAIAKVKESNSERGLVLDESFLPNCLSCSASNILAGLINETYSLLFHRAGTLVSRVSSPGRGNVADMAEFLLLQLINRNLPLFANLTKDTSLHPQMFYRYAAQLMGELATFTTVEKCPSQWPDYNHYDLNASLLPIMEKLRLSLQAVVNQVAVAIALQTQKSGIHIAAITDKTLMHDANFVLAIKADIDVDTLHNRLPTQIKIGPLDKIQDLISSQVPGIELELLPVSPPQIPYHAGYSYFSLNSLTPLWKESQQSGGLAFHVSGDFPGLHLELWAIRG